MIAFRVELLCNGCMAHYASGELHDDHLALPQLSVGLLECAKEDGWTIDGAAHWCPKCTQQRTAEGDGSLGSAA